MDGAQSLELGRQVVNILIIGLGALAVIFILRNIFKLAWRIVRIILILLGLLIILGQIFGYLRVSFL